MDSIMTQAELGPGGRRSSSSSSSSSSPPGLSRPSQYYTLPRDLRGGDGADVVMVSGGGGEGGEEQHQPLHTTINGLSDHQVADHIALVEFESDHEVASQLNGGEDDEDGGSSSLVEASVHYAVDGGSQTGLIYDTKMMLHSTATGLPHPETPERISHIYAVLRANGVAQRMKRLPIREITREEVQLVHSTDIWIKVLATASIPPEQLHYLEPLYERNSLYINNSTALCARLSAGGTVEMCQAVAQGRIRNGFAVVRPPGHHAEPEESMGFCIFNNVAVAAKCIKSTYPEIQKILILDWDVHHGNGTQRAFNDDPDILYISLHRYDNGTFYPGTTFGSMTSVGEGAGIGKSVNIPWPDRGMSDADYVYAFQRVVIPIAYEFAPSMVIISAGFDAAAGDELGGCLVSPAGYAHMTQMLSGLANGKLVVALEGGYNVEAIAHSALACTRVLLGEAPPALPPMVASALATETVHQVCLVQSQYWNSISPVGLGREIDEAATFDDHVAHILKSSVSLAQILKLHRAQLMLEQFDMSEVPLAHDMLKTAFSGQIFATPNVFVAETLIFFAHDLGVVKAELESSSANVVMERSLLMDTSTSMLSWALSKGYAVLDLNLNAQLPIQRQANLSNKTVSELIRILVFYLWDNYIEIADVKNVVLIGHGGGCEALMSLVNGRTLQPQVKACVEVLSATVLPRVAKRQALRDWFYANSLVILPQNHIALVDGPIIGKRFGRLSEAKEKGLERVFATSISIMTSFIEQKLDPISAVNGGLLVNGQHSAAVVSASAAPQIPLQTPAPIRKSRFRPCIDIHNGEVKQIVGGTLVDDDNATLKTNHVSVNPPEYFANLYRHFGLEGGHVIQLGPGNAAAATKALAAWSGGLQIGGGITDLDAPQWIARGASKVIVTSYIFPNSEFSSQRLERIRDAVGKDKLVIDLSCRRTAKGWIVAMNRWQTLTDTSVSHETLSTLALYCSEFLIHAADVEGLCKGIDQDLVRLLGSWARRAGSSAIPITYAGGAKSIDDLQLVTELSDGLVDLTFGSALDIFGGSLVKFADLIEWNGHLEKLQK